LPAPTLVVVDEDTFPDAVAVWSSEARETATVLLLTVAAGLAVAETVAQIPPLRSRAAAPRALLITMVRRFTRGL
jgi:hypothetical protein